MQFLQERSLDWTWERRRAKSTCLSLVDHWELHILVVFIEIAAELESQLEIVSEVPRKSIGFFPDGRLPHVPSLVRSAAWDARCGGV